jgi:hypothetical protein
MLREMPPVARLLLLLFGMASLAGGVLAGLARLGWPVPAAQAAGWHGALMITAFFGTVISLERAVALGKLWPYLAPAAAGSAGIVLLAGGPLAIAQTLALEAAAILLAASLVVVRRQTALYTVVLALAVLCWLSGNLFWLASAELNAAVPWWLAFLVLTIAGERLELTRFLPTPQAARVAFAGIVAAVLGGATLAMSVPGPGLQLFSAALLALALWLLRYDIARRNAKQRGLPRFIAICLLSGYFWLLAAGLLGLAGAFVSGHALRDTALHSIGIGFVFAMVFGHAPIIFPAVTRVKVPYHPFLYLPLLLLHLSLGLRAAGTLAGTFPLTRLGGLSNALTLLVFIASLLTLVIGGRRKGQP